MKQTFSLSLLGIIPLLAHGQVSYEKIYLSSTTAQMNLIEMPSQNILTGLAMGPGISLINTSGTVIHTKHYWNDSMLVQQSLRGCTENSFYFVTAYSIDSCSAVGSTIIRHTHPLVGKIDSLGNVQGAHYYRLTAGTCSHASMDLEVTRDKGVITWGGGRPGPQWGSFAIRTDSLGGVVWAKHFNNNGGVQFIKELPGGDLLAGMNVGAFGAVVARMDANGNFLWCKSYIRPKGMVHDALIESDDSFIITGCTDSIASNMSHLPVPLAYNPKLFMMKLDGLGAVQWCRGFTSSPNKWYARQPSRIVRSLDGNYVLLANLGLPGFNIEDHPFLMKVDHNADTLWTNSNGVDGYRYLVGDLLASSDGGYFHSGLMYGDLPQNWGGAPYIFKADTEGQLSCHQRHHPIEIAELFPVDSSIVLTSVDGATAHQIALYDTSFAPISVYDACLITEVQRHTRQYPKKPLLRPNPNTGRFTVQFHDP
ncbi:MAG TPA: hypothetical protein PL070_03450, partial [Flavobacteriales bacterium]|nr:hypothetical protein [Flavobacteriales bacterium]